MKSSFFLFQFFFQGLQRNLKYLFNFSNKEFLGKINRIEKLSAKRNKMFRTQTINYSNPLHAKHIEQENFRIYKNLIHIYTRGTQIERNLHEYETRKVFLESNKLFKRVKDAHKIEIKNYSLQNKLNNIYEKPSVYSTQLNNDHWLAHLRHNDLKKKLKEKILKQNK